MTSTLRARPHGPSIAHRAHARAHRHERVTKPPVGRAALRARLARAGGRVSGDAAARFREGGVAAADAAPAPENGAGADEVEPQVTARDALREELQEVREQLERVKEDLKKTEEELEKSRRREEGAKGICVETVRAAMMSAGRMAVESRFGRGGAGGTLGGNAGRNSSGNAGEANRRRGGRRRRGRSGRRSSDLESGLTLAERLSAAERLTASERLSAILARNRTEEEADRMPDFELLELPDSSSEGGSGVDDGGGRRAPGSAAASGADGIDASGSGAGAAPSPSERGGTSTGSGTGASGARSGRGDRDAASRGAEQNHSRDEHPATMRLRAELLREWETERDRGLPVHDTATEYVEEELGARVQDTRNFFLSHTGDMTLDEYLSDRMAIRRIARMNAADESARNEDEDVMDTASQEQNGNGNDDVPSDGDARGTDAGGRNSDSGAMHGASVANDAGGSTAAVVSEDASGAGSSGTDGASSGDGALVAADAGLGAAASAASASPDSSPSAPAGSNVPENGLSGDAVRTRRDTGSQVRSSGSGSGVRSRRSWRGPVPLQVVRRARGVPVQATAGGSASRTSSGAPGTNARGDSSQGPGESTGGGHREVTSGTEVDGVSGGVNTGNGSTANRAGGSAGGSSTRGISTVSERPSRIPRGANERRAGRSRPQRSERS